MFLAWCSYMLLPLIHALRRRGLPFHNPYRCKRFDWNPLRHDRKRMSAADRLLAYMKVHNEYEVSEYWSLKEFEMWTQWLRPDAGLVDGATEVIKNNCPEHSMNAEHLR